MTTFCRTTLRGGLRLLLFLLSGTPAPGSTWVELGAPPGTVYVDGLDASRTGIYLSCWRGDVGHWISMGLWKHPGTAVGQWDSLGLATYGPGDVRTTGLDQGTIVVVCGLGVFPCCVSTDDGVSWECRGTGMVPGERLWRLGVDKQVPSVIYSPRPGHERIYRSTDLGRTWQYWGSGRDILTTWWGTQPLIGDSQVAYSIETSGYGQVLTRTTTDRGLSWSWIPGDPYADGGYGALAVSRSHQDAIFATTAWVLWENTTGGWRTHDLPRNYYWTTCTIPFWAPDRIYIAGLEQFTNHPRVFKSEDLGETWVDVSQGLPAAPSAGGDFVLTWAPEAGRLYLVDRYAASVWLLEEPVTVGLAETRPALPHPVAAPAESRVWVRPNPSSGSISIRISSLVESSGRGRPTTDGDARLTIRDVTGRSVRHLRPIDTAGGRTYSWDGRDERGVQVGTGCYFASTEGRADEKAGIFVVR